MIYRMRSMLLLFLSFGMSAVVAAEQMIEIRQGWVRLVPPVSQSTAAYFSIHNHGSQDDELVSVSSPVARKTMLHGTIIENGVARMVNNGPLKVPAQGEVSLTVGGMHLMLMQLKKPLQDQDTVMLHFQFKHAGMVMLDLPVETQAPVHVMDATEMSHHAHH